MYISVYYLYMILYSFHLYVGLYHIISFLNVYNMCISYLCIIHDCMYSCHVYVHIISFLNVYNHDNII